MFLSPEIVRWAIDRLRENCHPFVGITFLASKRTDMPIGQTTDMSLDAVTKHHLEEHHRLDPKSEFFFQPFKSNRSNTYWVRAKYPSSGLQAINTQTFKDVFIHPKKSRKWGFSEEYVNIICNRIAETPGYGPASLAALAIWVGKHENWEPDVNAKIMTQWFHKKFNLTEEELSKLFETLTVPPDTLPMVTENVLDLKVIAHDCEVPPDAPSQTEGALTSIHLMSVGPADELHLDFGKRLTLIAGDNGLGKSFLLDTAWWALTGTWAARPAFPFVSAGTTKPRIEYEILNADGRKLSSGSDFDWSGHTWRHLPDRPSVAALNIYTRADGSFAIADETRSRLQVNKQSPLSQFSIRDVWDGKNGEIEGIIRDWVSWQLSSNSDPFVMLCRVLEHLSPDDMSPLAPSDPIRIPGDPRQIPTIKHIYGDVPILFASAGVQRILMLAYLIIWSWQEHTLASEQAGVLPQQKMVIIIDELEAHLHPKWQRLVLPAIMSVGKLLSDELEVQVIAATHSPMVLASVEEEFSDESDTLAHLSLRDNSVQLEQLDFYKYGDMSSWLMSPIFGLAHARSRSAEKIIEEAKALQLSSHPSSQSVKEVTAQLKKALSPEDPFWSRWIYFARRLGDDI